MAHLRRPLDGGRQQNERPRYIWPLRPTTTVAGGALSSPSRPGKLLTSSFSADAECSLVLVLSISASFSCSLSRAGLECCDCLRLGAAALIRPAAATRGMGLRKRSSRYATPHLGRHGPVSPIFGDGHVTHANDSHHNDRSRTTTMRGGTWGTQREQSNSCNAPCSRKSLPTCQGLLVRSHLPYLLLVLNVP